MTHYRTLARQQVRAALSGDAHFDGFKDLRAFGSSVSIDALPAFAVTTPAESTTRVSTKNVARVPRIMVGFRRVGGEDIEDELDEDSTIAEPLILTALKSVEQNAELTDTRMEISGEGATRVGTLILEFSFTRNTSEGAPT